MLPSYSSSWKGNLAKALLAISLGSLGIGAIYYVRVSDFMKRTDTRTTSPSIEDGASYKNVKELNKPSAQSYGQNSPISQDTYRNRGSVNTLQPMGAVENSVLQ